MRNPVTYFIVLLQGTKVDYFYDSGPSVKWIWTQCLLITRLLCQHLPGILISTYKQSTEKSS